MSYGVILLALIIGAALGILTEYIRLRRGFTRDEWIYLRDFYTALRAGEYEELEDEEKGE